MWFVETSDAVWVATSVATRKVADVERDPRVTFTVEGRHGALTTSATVVSIDAEPAVLSAFAQRYEGWDAADPSVDGPRVLIRLSR